MHNFVKKVIFVKHLFKSELYFGHILQYFDNISSIYKLNPLLQSNTKVLFSPSSYTKMFCSDERLIFVIPIPHVIIPTNSLYIFSTLFNFRLFPHFLKNKCQCFVQIVQNRNLSVLIDFKRFEIKTYTPVYHKYISRTGKVIRVV